MWRAMKKEVKSASKSKRQWFIPDFPLADCWVCSSKPSSQQSLVFCVSKSSEAEWERLEPQERKKSVCGERLAMEQI